MKTKNIIFFLFTLCLLSIRLIGQPNKALIIANDDYIELSDLRFSLEQTNELEQVLLQKGYDVTLLRNATRPQMLKALNDFFLKESSRALFYFSGHIYDNNSEEDIYLVPVDAKVRIRNIEQSDLISVDSIRSFSFNASHKHKIFMFDVVNNFGLKEIKEEPLLVPSMNNTIVFVNNNLQRSPYETSYFLSAFLDELQYYKTVIGTFESILKRSYQDDSRMKIALFQQEFTPDLLWTDEPPVSSGTEFMPSFPFPPPKASASYVFDKKYLSKAEHLFEVSEILNHTLNSCGYRERSFYQIPEGFALVTRIEKIEMDATPAQASERWNAPSSKDDKIFSISDYFYLLFRAKKGKYRIIVFMVTSMPFHQAEKKMDIVQAEKYLKGGYNVLPNAFKTMAFTSDYDCTALIYEFDKIEYESGTLVENSKFPGYEHLKRNDFLPTLTRK